MTRFNVTLTRSLEMTGEAKSREEIEKAIGELSSHELDEFDGWEYDTSIFSISSKGNADCGVVDGRVVAWSDYVAAKAAGEIDEPEYPPDTLTLTLTLPGVQP